MKYWLLGVACLVYAAATLASAHVSPEASRVLMFATYAIASGAGVATALDYGRRDLLRWAWLSFSAGYGIAFLSKVFIGDSRIIPTMSHSRLVFWSISIVLLNVGTVTALSLFSRVWSGTGLSPPWRRWATLAFVALALALDHKNFIVFSRAILTLQPQAFGLFASVTGDLIAIALVGPIFATMIALRGGLLVRPWLFLFLSVLCWVVDDMTAVMPPAIGLPLDSVARPLAVLLGGAAALAQLWVKHEVRAGFAEVP